VYRGLIYSLSKSYILNFKSYILNQTSNIKHQTSNIKNQTSNIKHQKSNIKNPHAPRRRPNVLGAGCFGRASRRPHGRARSAAPPFALAGCGLGIEHWSSKIKH
jgi:hypothetical protein